MPRSIFLGRAMPAPGEPLFLPEDTAAALALAEEERDTCPACGLPKAWCRSGGLKDIGRFAVVEETCWASYRLALERNGDVAAATKSAKQARLAWRKGYVPDVTAGLGLELDDGDGGAGG